METSVKASPPVVGLKVTENVIVSPPATVAEAGFTVKGEEAVKLHCAGLAESFVAVKELVLLCPTTILPKLNDVGLIKSFVLPAAQTGWIALPEYLIALKLVAGRPKDYTHILNLLSNAQIDFSKLAEIVSRFDLTDKWNRFLGATLWGQ